MKKFFWIVIPSSLVPLCLYSFTIGKIHGIEKMIDKQGFAVIELFTSEGCSSCPPADEAVTEIQKSYQDKNVLMLGYHVDYWDHLGWKDPFSSSDFTQRQQYYAGIFNLHSIYTPQVVINGKKQFVGSERDKLITETDKALEETPRETIQLSAKETGIGKIDISYWTKEKIAEEEEAILLLIQKTATNKIKKGENEGKLSHHINIVKKIIYLLPFTQGTVVNLVLPPGSKKEDFFIASLVQSKTSGKISAMITAPID